MTDHLEIARAALTVAGNARNVSTMSAESALQVAQVHALIAIAESLKAMTSGSAVPSVPRTAAPSRRLLPGEAEILATPEPRSRRCPACQHDTAVHRMHGCDVIECECLAPHGRILPGDPQPNT